MRDFAEAESLGLGKVAQPMRVALTGRTVSPGVFDMMEILGREESLARLEDCARTVADRDLRPRRRGRRARRRRAGSDVADRVGGRPSNRG